MRYRLAPGIPTPPASEDCYRALTWLAGLPGVDVHRIAIGGASAGGGLAAALAFRARVRAEVTPVLQLLSYLMLDDRSVDPSQDRADSGCGTPQAIASGLDVVPARCGIRPKRYLPGETILAGLPAAWIGVGTLDLFHHEDLAYAARLTAAGVPCQTYEVPGAFHGFDGLALKTPVAIKRYFDNKCAAPCAARWNWSGDRRCQPGLSDEPFRLRDAVPTCLPSALEAEVR